MGEAIPAANASEVRLLRHTLATLAYRAEKVLREAPPGYADLRLNERSRSPAELAAHLGDLMEWAESLVAGRWDWKAAGAGSFEGDVARFFAAIERLDDALARGRAPGHPPQVIFQGPIADALTHVGQLALLRGLAGVPVRPESYARARIEPGRVGREQSTERREFDGDASARG
jgi:hypothetical protein